MFDSDWYHIIFTNTEFLIIYLFTVGYDKVDPLEGNSLKNQTVGLLQAVSYLKGFVLLSAKFIYFIPWYTFNCYISNSPIDCDRCIDHLGGVCRWRIISHLIYILRTVILLFIALSSYVHHHK
jgi:hypothetical protein